MSGVSINQLPNIPVQCAPNKLSECGAVWRVAHTQLRTRSECTYAPAGVVSSQMGDHLRFLATYTCQTYTITCYNHTNTKTY